MQSAFARRMLAKKPWPDERRLKEALSPRISQQVGSELSSLECFVSGERRLDGPGNLVCRSVT